MGEGCMTASRSARNTAMDLLARREHSRVELRDKLRQRHFDAQQIEAALDQLEQEGLQNDARYAETYVHLRMLKGYGPVRISHELHQRGIADELTKDVLDSHRSEWIELMQQQRTKKFGSEIPQEYAARMKQARFLQNRGFSPESVMRLFR